MHNNEVIKEINPGLPIIPEISESLSDIFVLN